MLRDKCQVQVVALKEFEHGPVSMKGNIKLVFKSVHGSAYWGFSQYYLCDLPVDITKLRFV